MHVSLDSALGRQRRLNSVGESVLQIAPNAAAAYSLRSLTGGDPKVVRVRRASDNGERDFTSSEITSGEMVSWVNRQVIAPLDIQALEADGRTGDFLIAKAAYSLRSLGTRQATLVADGDTVARANGKYVVQVRRSSDNALKSFTADEVADGTLLSFVNEIQTVGTAVNGTGSVDNYTVSNLSTTGFSADNSAGGTGSAGFPYVFGDGDVIVARYTVTNFSSTSGLSPQIRGVTSAASVNTVASGGTTFTANGTYTDTLTATADGSHLMFADGNTGSYTISDFEIVSHSSNGFVKTWYDQSVTTEQGNVATSNHAVQGTPANQPKIVNAGSLVADNGIDFDGSGDILTASSLSGMGSSISVITASIRDSGAGASVSVGSSASSANTYFAIIEGGSVSQANARNTTSVAASASVSGATRLSFALTTGQTSTKSGALGGTLVESTSDYGDDFTSGELDTVTIGKLRPTSGTTFNGRMREILIYNSDQTDNRGAIEANIGEAYSITGIPAYDNEVDGFVETWYDQSGNGNDAVQATAAEQPKIVDAGSLLTAGVTFDGGDSLSVSGDPVITESSSGVFSAFSVQTVATTEAGYLYGNTSAANGASFYAGADIFTLSNKINASLDKIARSSGQNLLSAVYNNGDAGLLVNGAGTMTDAGTYDFSAGSSDFVIGNRNGGSLAATFLTGSINEIVVYNSNQSSNRTALETEIISHYVIS